MDVIINPFITNGYVSKEYFCDRESELKMLCENLENRVNITLISARRFGKSALIYRIFEHFNDKKDRICIFTDMYATQNLKDFTEILAMAVLKSFPDKNSLGKRFLKLLKGFRPIVSYDGLSGQPELHFEFTQPKECEQLLIGLLNFIDNQQIKILIAIDEFQQVANYPEKNTEAILRTVIQTLKNVQFIFSGSNKHLMVEIFNSAKRPFFSSTQMLGLTSIPSDKYKEFISKMFENHKREILEDALDFVIDWTRSHTYYTQVLCNKIFTSKTRKITIDVVKLNCNEILTSQQVVFMQYKNLLSPMQWSLLIAIAKEETLSKPQSKTFLQNHKLGAASTVKKTLDALIEKEMVYCSDENDVVYYQVYDLFLSRWLQRVF
jgi:hypothetical protein